jgi:phosphoglycerate dehydrogenase-like enzyme
LTKSTRGVIGPAELDLIDPGGWLINVGRGALADEDALASAQLRRYRTGQPLLNVVDKKLGYLSRP